MYQPWVYLRGGIERWILEVVTRSRHDWTIYTHHYDPDGTFPAIASLDVVELEPRVSVERSFRQLAKASKTIARTQLPDDGAEVVVISSEGLGDLIAARERRPLVCYCHTPLKILHDEATNLELRRRSPKQALALRFLGPPFAAVDRAMWRRFAHVLVNSSETASRVLSARLATEVEVLRPGVDIDRWGAPERLTPTTGPTVLLVAGRIMWQKHVDLAIDTLRVLVETMPALEVELVVAGAVDAKSKDYYADIERLAAGLPVRFVINPTDEELRACYHAADLLLFTPPNEDWGIVPLEAMAAGLPVVAINAGGPRESVEQGESGWLLPDDASSWAATVGSFATLDEAGRQRHRDAARLRAASFSWDAMVARFDDVLEDAARVVR